MNLQIKSEKHVLLLRSKYEDYFMSFDGASEVVANDICKRITV
jgi:hypothetical protein